jgi:hypothetical protein
VIGNLEDVEVIQILGDQHAWVVQIIQWVSHVSADEFMQEIAVFLQQDFIEEGDTSNADYELKYSLSKHLGFIFTLFGSDRELLLWDYSLEDIY